VPIYIHPGPPHPAMAAAYYNDYLQDHPFLNSAAWGFTIDTATQVLRLILSGVFDAYPRLKMIVGHLGEGIPYLVDRIDESLNRPGGKPVEFKKIFCEHFWITTSGHFSTPALMCALMELGIDRILFSVDWPYVENQPGMDWMQTVPLSAEDKEKMLNGNARKLLKL
jgi:predicted TIM-barrel fold metal-dependent hydrolase